MDNYGQISAEFLMVVGLMVVVSCSVISAMGPDIELNHAMAAARSGASEGALADSLGVYSDDAFNDYFVEDSRLLSPSSVKIIKIDYINLGFNPTYNRIHIQLQIYATGSHMSSSDQYDLGERINYDARKSICDVFGTDNITSYYYNPAFTDRYAFTTLAVNWV